MASLAAQPWLLARLHTLAERLRDSGWRHAAYMHAIVRALRPLEQPGARKAFVHTLRSVIDVHGQRVSASDRLYLLAGMPTLILWGERDNTIPLAHGVAAQKAAPGARFQSLPRAAHFPHLEDPEGVALALLNFIQETGPARVEDGDWADLISPRRQRAPAAPSLSLD
jgi:pimeloyl-ACP methyl ester carboxylesterase